MGGWGVINLINGGFPNKKGRGRQKSEKLTSGGYLFGTGKYLRAKPWHGIFCIYLWDLSFNFLIIFYNQIYLKYCPKFDLILIMQVWFSNKIRGHPQRTSNYEGEGGFENQNQLGIGGKWFWTPWMPWCQGVSRVKHQLKYLFFCKRMQSLLQHIYKIYILFILVIL